MNLTNVFKNTFDIKPTDKILIITDKKKYAIARKIFLACYKLSPNIHMVIKDVGKYHGEEPPKHISSKMKRYDIVIAPTTYSLTHTKARREASALGVKIATMPGVTEQMLRTSLLADPKKLFNIGRRIEKFLKLYNLIKVSTPKGTFLKFFIKGRKIENDCGLLNKPKSFGNLPAGEVSLAPIEKTTNGILVIDDMEDFAKPGTRIYIKNGKVTYISDKKCKLAKIFSKIENSTNVAEFGIGTNYKSKIINKILQDEKVLGTCHIAFGNNMSYGGHVYSKVHLDTVLFKPTIYTDDKIMMEKGKLKI